METNKGTETQIATTNSQFPLTNGLIDISPFPSAMWGEKHPRSDSDFSRLMEQPPRFRSPIDPGLETDAGKRVANPHPTNQSTDEVSR